MSVNKAILLGNLGKDPEFRITPSQVHVCTFSIATSEKRRDQSGNMTEQTEWHNIVTFGVTADNCSKYIKKGSQVYVEGRIQTRKWQDKEGKDRYTTEIITDRVNFIGGRREAGSNDSAPAYGAEATSYTENFSSSSSSSPNGGGANGGSAIPVMGLKSADQINDSLRKDKDEVTFDDDDIPF